MHLAHDQVTLLYRYSIAQRVRLVRRFNRSYDDLTVAARYVRGLSGWRLIWVGEMRGEFPGEFSPRDETPDGSTHRPPRQTLPKPRTKAD